MSKRILRAIFGAFSCLTISSIALAAPSSSVRRGITEKDLFDFVWIGDPQLSPDGSRVAYVRVTVDEKRNGYDMAIWLAPTAPDPASAGPRQLTSGPRDSSRLSASCASFSGVAVAACR